MERQGKFIVRVYADSRGAWLAHELRKFTCTEIDYSVHYRKGATLREIWAMIEMDLFATRIDFVFVLAGVCDITDFTYTRTGRRYVLPPFDMDKRFCDIEKTMLDIENNFRLIGGKCKLSFIQEVGIDTIRYNRIRHPVPASALITQASLENNLRRLQLFTKSLNDKMNVPTLWSLIITHAKKEGVWIPVFDRTYDGLHFSRKQTIDLAKAISNYVYKVIYRHI